MELGTCRVEMDTLGHMDYKAVHRHDLTYGNLFLYRIICPEAMWGLFMCCKIQAML